MKLSDPKGDLASHEQRFTNLDECLQEAKKAFKTSNGGGLFYKVNNGNGYSFMDKAGIEQRFVYLPSNEIITSPIDYYLALDEKDNPITSFDEFSKSYERLPQAGYGQIVAPAPDGGLGDNQQPTARCIIQASDKSILGLIINPPFPHGHPVGGKKAKVAEKYLFLAAGLVAGLTLVPVLKELNKLIGSKWHYAR